jgi:hypothetical protein
MLVESRIVEDRALPPAAERFEFDQSDALRNLAVWRFVGRDQR